VTWRGHPVVLAFGFGLGIVAVAVATPLGHALLRAVALLAAGDVDGLRTLVLEAGAVAPAVLAGLMILQAVIVPLPSSPVTYVNGLLFGVWWGGLLSWASALLAAALCFALSRRFGRPVAGRVVTARAIEWSDRFFGRFGAYAVLVGRLLPVVSFDVISYGAGLTRMSFAGFMTATATGMIPGTLLYAYLGELGRESGAALMWTLAALTALGLVVLLAGRRFSRRLIASPGDCQPGVQRRPRLPHEGRNDRC
jgi:uncharacterized membrane protein YdjX (TVP38/TMEM64 family)